MPDKKGKLTNSEKKIIYEGIKYLEKNVKNMEVSPEFSKKLDKFKTKNDGR